MYVVDAGRARDTSSIASVSGGSITNGFLAQTLDFQGTDSAAFDQKVAGPLARQIATKGTLFVPLFTWLYLALLVLAFLVAFLPIWFLDAPWWGKVLAVLGLLMVWGWLFGRRGWVCAQAFRSTLFSPAGKTTELRNVVGKVSHVLCATELRSSQSVYFSNDFVYAFALGPGVPGDLPLYRAVQASAAFPGGFPPARLPAARHQFKGPLAKREPKRDVRDLILTDGGVYDNMGDQWARGFGERAELWPWLAGKPAPKQLVVVNASARIHWSPFRRGRIPLLGELLAFIRVNNILYINTTNVRRQEVVRSFDPAAPDRCGELPGVLVQIAQSPFAVARSYAGAGILPVADRAKAVIEALGPANQESWQEIATRNSGVATTLRKLGPEVSARLLYHGYVTAMCNLHVVFGDPTTGGWPLLAIPSRDRFDHLVR
jgi:hypothetical protein